MAGIFGGLQSLHTDAYDEVLSVPTEHAARIAVCTQNILREEAHLGDVIDPLGGSYYLEHLTDETEALIESLMAKVDDAGGMYRAVETGLVQTMIGESAMRFQARVDSGEQSVVGVNKYRLEEDSEARASLKRPSPEMIEAQLESLKRYKKGRDNAAVQRALDTLTRAAVSENENAYAAVVDATIAGATHGEVVATLATASRSSSRERAARGRVRRRKRSRCGGARREPRRNREGDFHRRGGR
jgi:methylmalonyl-CoA mutase N-terminal domain/subunit